MSKHICEGCAFSEHGECICLHSRHCGATTPVKADECSWRSGGLPLTQYVTVTSYGGECGYRGYVEPKDMSWILYIRDDGTPEFYPRRGPTGAVLTPPATIPPAV